MPFTHTPRAAVPGRKVTTDPLAAATLPLGASSPIGAIAAVVAMTVIVLTVAVNAVLVVLDDHPHRVGIAVGFVGVVVGWMALLAVPAVVSRLRRHQPGSDGQDQATQLAHPTAGTRPATTRQTIAGEDVR